MELSERELTRLSFLVAEVVATPDRAGRFFELVSQSNASPAFVGLVKDFTSRMSSPDASTREGLRSVATTLLADADEDRRTLGRLLAGAIEVGERRTSELPVPPMAAVGGR